MTQAFVDEWTGEGVKLAQVEEALARLRSASEEDRGPNLRTSVMTHLAWVPEQWLDAARETLHGMAERHPSRTILLVPEPDAGDDRIDAEATVECYPLSGTDRHVCSEVVELHLLGRRCAAPASIVLPLLIPDLPVFCRWRGEPPWDSPQLEQLVDVTDRLVLDSTEWENVPGAYGNLVPLFERTAVSDIAWARTARWRALLASLWPGIAEVQAIRVHGTKAQAHLLAGWLRSRLGRPELELEHEAADTLEGIDLDGEPAPFPPGDPPEPSDVLSEELDTLSRDRIYEEAVAAAG
ncbi:MAG: hypothetical protein QOE36_357 [Gaiellaceae bacterium]|jgi:glucose-6-phosphate dehydrogenase assembly protein OpcA|nr:hypothetical protein [Gaiellaceae bacterium]